MLVYNKQLLFNMHCTNLKITVQTDTDGEGSCIVIAFIGKPISVFNSV